MGVAQTTHASDREIYLSSIGSRGTAKRALVFDPPLVVFLSSFFFLP